MKFLLDYHISPRVIAAFQRCGGKSEILAMRDWHSGDYIQQHGESDLPWLRVAGREGWVIVTDDRNPLLGELASLYEEGVALPGFAVVGSAHQSDIAWIARRLLKVEQTFTDQKPANVQLFLS